MKLSRNPILLAVTAVLLRTLVYKLASLPFGRFADAMCQFDCGWYLRIAASGYGANADFANYGALPHWVFFPLFPLLLRLPLAVFPNTGELFGQEVAGLFAAGLLYLGFILVALLYARRTRPALDQRLLLAVLILSPYSYFFSAVYTEGLFNLLLLGSLLLLAERRVLAAAICTALLCATRPTGVIMLAPIAVERLTHLWRNWKSSDRIALLGETLLPIAIAPLGLSLFMTAQYVAIGDGLAFSHMQLLWNRHWVGPFAMMAQGLRAWDWSNLLDPRALPSQSYDAAWALIGLGLAGFLAWRRRFAEAWVTGASVLLPLATGLDSMARFVATSPFFLFTLAGAISRLQARWALATVFVVLALLQAATLGLWFVAANSAY